MEQNEYIDVFEQRRRVKQAFVAWLAVWTLVLVLALLTNFRHEWRLNNVYVQAEATILDKHYETEEAHEGGHYHEAKFLVRYRPAAGAAPCEAWAYFQAYPQPRDHTHAKALFEHFQVGRDYPCWYDPDDPDKVAL